MRHSLIFLDIHTSQISFSCLFVLSSFDSHEHLIVFLISALFNLGMRWRFTWYYLTELSIQPELSLVAAC